MNKVWIAGHLGTDPEVRFAPSGQKITSLRVATNSRRQGKDETIWWRVTLFGERFDKVISYFKKGSGILVVGSLNPIQIWTDREGRPQASYELIGDSIDFPPGNKGERQPMEQSSMGSSGGDFRAAQPNGSRDGGYGSIPHDGGAMRGGSSGSPFATESTSMGAADADNEEIPF